MKKQKKVLFVATVASHIKGFHEPYLKLLHDNGYKTYVASKDNLNDNDTINYCDKFIEIPIERSPYKLSNIKAIKELKKIINEEKFDIVHCHTPMGSVVARIATKEARKKYGTRVIYTCHGFHFYKGAPKLNWFLFYPIEKFLSKYNDTLVTINKEDYELARNKFKKRCSDIHYLPGIGVDSSKFILNMDQKEKDNLRKKLNISDTDFIIIYPARLCYDKNQSLLLQFMKKIDNNNIILLLPGRDEYKGNYQKYVKDNNIKNVLFLGERNDISKLLKISDLLIASSIREGFGINLVEALTCEIPVIAVNNRGHREIIKDGTNGFIIKNSIDDLINKFNLMYNNKDLYKKIKLNCVKSVEKYYLYNTLKIMKKIYKL